MSIKTSADEWVRKGPTQAIAVVAVVGIIVGGLIGLGVGFKIEQSRTKDQVNKLQKQAASLGVVIGSLGRRVGPVTATSAKTLTVTTKKDGSQTLETTPQTLIGRATAGTIADVHPGRRILVTNGGSEIIVLSATSRLGRPVTNVGSAAITVKNEKNGKSGTIKVAGVHRVATLKPAKLADVSKGDQVMAFGRAKDGKTFSTVEVILLPDGSGFAT